MDRHLVGAHLRLGLSRLFLVDLAQMAHPTGVAPRAQLPFALDHELLQDRLRVAHDAHVEGPSQGDFPRVDVDLEQLRIGSEARRQEVAADVAHTGADGHDQVGLPERRVASGQEG